MQDKFSRKSNQQNLGTIKWKQITSSPNIKFQHNSFVSLCVSGCNICNFEGDAGEALLYLSKLPLWVSLFVGKIRKYFYFPLQYSLKGWTTFTFCSLKW